MIAELRSWAVEGIGGKIHYVAAEISLALCLFLVATNPHTKRERGPFSAYTEFRLASLGILFRAAVPAFQAGEVNAL